VEAVDFPAIEAGSERACSPSWRFIGRLLAAEFPVMSIFSRWAKLQRFRNRQQRETIVVSDSPHFESKECVDFFTAELMRCGHYVEFGSGGSTMLAATLRKPSVSVESDLFYLSRVRQTLIDKGLFDPALQTLRGVDIGPTVEWGRPWRTSYVGRARRKAFASYSDFPCDMRSFHQDAALVLVDGRFRVACALKAMRALRAVSDWTLIVDDYTGRPEYSVIESFATADRFVGRMAVFKSVTARKPSELDAAIAQYETDPA
jgi:hypothetical protein